MTYRNPYVKSTVKDETVQDHIFRLLSQKACTKTQLYRQTNATAAQIDEAFLILADLDLIRYRTARTTFGKKPFKVYWLLDADYSPETW